MRISLLTIFPEFFAGALDQGMIRVARERGLLDVQLVNLRDFTKDRHRTTDDAPFGGGVGMVMLPEPVFAAVEAVAPEPPPARHVVLLTPQGRPFRQADAIRLSGLSHVVLVSGRYKGVDERVA
jgi:tRNA (guanine37-N1)-methyltransferase